MVEKPDVLEKLYAVEPEEFVAERKRLESSLREQGRTEEADEVATLRKPALPVFAANRLAREHADDVAQLISAGERLAAAHRAANSDELRKVQAELTDRITTLVRHAERAARRPISESMEQRIVVLLRAAASDPDSAALLRRGVLSEEVQPTAFDALAGMRIAAPKSRPGTKGKPNAASVRKRRKRVEELEGQLSEASSALRRAERELGEAERELERTTRRVNQLEKRLEEARRTV